jgi:hypothetical protein
MQPFSLTCNHCGASYRVTKEEEVGKWLDCPKCTFPFMAHRPFDEERQDSNDSWDDSPRAGRPKSPTSPIPVPHDRENKNSTARTVLVALAMLALFGLKVAARIRNQARNANQAPIVIPQNWPVPNHLQGFADALRGIGPGHLGDEAEFLQPETEMISLTRPLGILRSPVFAGEEESELADSMGLSGDTSVVHTVSATVARSNITRRLVDAMLHPEAGLAADSPGDLSLAVRLPGAFTPGGYAWDTEFDRISVDNGTYYFDPAEDAEAVGLNARTQVEPDLFVVSSEPRILEILAGERSTSLEEAFGFAEGEYHWMTAYRPYDLESLREAAEADGHQATGLPKLIFDYYDKGARGVALTVRFEQDVELRLSVQGTDSATAENLRSEIAQILTEAAAVPDSPERESEDPLLKQLRPAFENVESHVSRNCAVFITRVSKHVIPAIFEGVQTIFPGESSGDDSGEDDGSSVAP